MEVPPVLAPMNAGSVGMPADPAVWVFEPKWDGVRIVSRLWPQGMTLTSRAGNDVTAGYPELAGMAQAIEPRAAVLDGEVVAFDDRGRPSFERLQRRMHVRHPPRSLLNEVPVLYVVFDVLWLDGDLLTDRPLTERRERLDELELKGSSWQVSTRLDGIPTDELLDRCRQAGLEGYLGKQAASAYLPGRRTKAWTKVKCVRQREFVVGGWSEGAGGRAGQLGSLGVGWVDADAAAPAGQPFALRYAGQVGSGLNDFLLRHLGQRFAELASDASPFLNPPKAPKLHHLRPEVVAQVKFTEMTTAGILRQPSLKGIRDDIRPADVGWSEELGSAPSI